MEFIKPMELGHFYFSELAPIYETFIKNIYSTLSLVAVFHLRYFNCQYEFPIQFHTLPSFLLTTLYCQ